MIPKIIHFCWFGRNPPSETMKICIDSWKRNCPDFEIKEWNEDTFDVNSHPFVKECYESKKFGFIVDVLRAYVLKEWGGIYVDTDTEIIKPFPQSMLDLEAFISYETDSYPSAGLVASEKNGTLVNNIYKLYSNKHFFNEDGTMNMEFTGPVGFAEVLKKAGVKLNGRYQNIEGLLTIFPKEYFCPKDYHTGLTKFTQNTYAIHHYESSWHTEEQKQKTKIRQYTNRVKGSLKALRPFTSDKELLSLFQEYTGITSIQLIKLLINRFKI